MALLFFFRCMCLSPCIVCVLEGDPTARQPAGSFYSVCLVVEIQSYFHTGLTIDLFCFLSESLFEYLGFRESCLR
jgi:hypothetical protein